MRGRDLLRRPLDSLLRRGRDLLRDLGFLTGSLGPIGSIEGSLLANFVSLVAAGNVNSSQLAIVGSIYALSPLFRWVNAYSNKQSAPRAGCTWPWGGDQKSLLSYGGRAPFSRLWIVGRQLNLSFRQALGGKLRAR